MPTALDYGVDDVYDVVTNTFGLEVRERGKELDLLCPNPKHNESKPSCSINRSTGYWNCLACGVGGDLAELGALVLGQPLAAVSDALRPNSPEAILAAVQRRVARLTARPPRRLKRVVLPEYEPGGNFQELYDRSFTPATLERWGVRYVEEDTFTGNKGEYTIRHSIAIPLRSGSGDLLAWCYRSTENSPSWQPRYLYTPGVEISELWFGLEHHHNARHISVVEGALDGMWLDQCGYPALALLGSKMGERKISWLQRYRSVTMVPDLDEAGLRWSVRVGATIGTRVPLYVAQYRTWMLKKRPEPDGSYRRAKDPEELEPLDVELMHALAQPYINWTRARLPKVHSTSSDRFGRR